MMGQEISDWLGIARAGSPEDAKGSVNPTVGEKNGEAQIGGQVPLEKRAVSPPCVCRCIGHKQWFLRMAHGFPKQPGVVQRPGSFCMVRGVAAEARYEDLNVGGGETQNQGGGFSRHLDHEVCHCLPCAFDVLGNVDLVHLIRINTFLPPRLCVQHRRENAPHVLGGILWGPPNVPHQAAGEPGVDLRRQFYPFVSGHSWHG